MPVNVHWVPITVRPTVDASVWSRTGVLPVPASIVIVSSVATRSAIGIASDVSSTIVSPLEHAASAVAKSGYCSGT